MKPLFDLEDVQVKTDQRTYERAVGIYESGNIANVQKGTAFYTANVHGTHVYTTSVDMKSFEYGHCTCYLGQQDILCKHMIALALYAVKDGKPLQGDEKMPIGSPTCSGNLGELSEIDLAETNTAITVALKHVKQYEGPSSTWFAYQSSLDEGRSRLTKIISPLPVSEQTANILVKLLLRLDRKLFHTAVDDSNGTIGGLMDGIVFMLQEYAELDANCIKSFKKLRNRDTGFGWEESLLEMLDMTDGKKHRSKK